jgi:site-specific DNA recombinase
VKTKAPVVQKQIRCAIYTRKSTEEGLELEFNSLDAQRESAEPTSPAAARVEGLLPTATTMGDTGGNMGPSGVRRLMDDNALGKATRSSSTGGRLFAQLAGLRDEHGGLDKKGVPSFRAPSSSTTNSMGRLTLNILLSFAAVRGTRSCERTRDKIGAHAAREVDRGHRSRIRHRPRGAAWW